MNRIIVVVLCFLCTCAGAQVSSNDITRKYSAFSKALPLSKLHFVLNQDKYATGDTIFFKGYFLKEDNQPVAGHQLINVSLVDKTGSAVTHFVFPIDNGVGASQVILPETLSPGVYTLTAFSTWMKNYEIPPIFTKDIAVVRDKRVISNDQGSFAKVSATKNLVTVTIPDQRMARYQRMNLIVTNKGQVTFVRSFVQGIDKVASIALTNDALRPGINIINIVDRLWSTVGTLSVYIPEEHPVTVNIDSEKILATRKNSSVTVTLVDENKQPVQGEFSISVLNPIAADSATASFAEQLAGSAPKIQSWRQILNGQATQRYNYKTDLSKTGRVFLPDGKMPREETRILFYLQESDVTTQAMTSAGGKIKVSIPDIKGNDELFYLADYVGEEIPGVSIKWETTTLKLPSAPSSTESSEGDLYGVFAADKRLIDRAFSFKSESAADIAKQIERNHSDLESKIISGPDITVKVDNYVLFETMSEMITEIVPALSVRKVRGVPVTQMALQVGTALSTPLYIIDGVVTKDTQYFLSLKPSDLESVKLVTNPRKFAPLGPIARSGVVIVESKRGNLRPPYDPSLQVEGLNRTVTFKSATNLNVRRPDFRSTIYWNPIVKTDNNGKAVVDFQSSDDLGPIKIRVNGMTRDGRPFSGETIVTQVLSENK